MNIKEGIIEWWDWKVYRLSYVTFNRMAKRNPGYAYLFKLNVEKWLEENPISPELERSTEQFFKSLVNYKPPIDQEPR